MMIRTITNEEALCGSKIHFVAIIWAEIWESLASKDSKKRVVLAVVKMCSNGYLLEVIRDGRRLMRYIVVLNAKYPKNEEDVIEQ